MSLMPIEESPRYQEMNDVIERFIVDKHNPTKIARDLGLRRVDVINTIEEWKRTAAAADMKDRVNDLITEFDAHYSALITKAYEIVKEVDELRHSDKETMTRSQMLSQKKGALDLIAKLEKDRIDVLQKSGLLEAADLGDELVQMEEEKEKILSVLTKEVLCTHCYPKVMGIIGDLLADKAKGNVVIVNE